MADFDFLSNLRQDQNQSGKACFRGRTPFRRNSRTNYGCSYGCVVNGPGEAREADIGIAGGIGEGLLFRKGEIIKKVSEDKIVDELFDEIKKILVERKMK